MYHKLRKFDEKLTWNLFKLNYELLLEAEFLSG